jgi:hypothetical protein
MINKAVNYLLKASTELAGLVGKKVFPIVMPEGTDAPCVVFFRDSLETIYDKGSPVVDESEVSVICFTKDYPDAIEIISTVRTILEGIKGDQAGINILLARVLKGEEGYDVDSDTFFQKLTFIFKSSKL